MSYELILKAVQEGDLKTVDSLLIDGNILKYIDLNQKKESRRSNISLFLVARAGHLLVVNRLLEIPDVLLGVLATAFSTLILILW